MMTTFKKRSITQIGVYAFFLLFWLFLFYPVLITRQSTFFYFADNLHQTYPFMCKLATSLHKGYLPIWDANTFGGKNFAGDPQTGIFYPPNLLFCWLFGTAKGIDVYWLDLLIALHYLIALTGMYSLSRTLRLSVPASVSAALVFSLTGVLAYRSNCESHIFFSLTYMPWLLYFVALNYRQRARIRYFVFAGLVGGFQILAGHVQPFFHSMLIAITLILYYEYHQRKDWKTFFWRIIRNPGLILIFTLLVAFPQIYYSAPFLVHSYREAGGGEFPSLFVRSGEKTPLSIYLYGFILKPSDFGNLLGEDLKVMNDYNFLYMGILPLILTLLFFFKIRTLYLTQAHRALTKILLFILVFGILCVLGYVTFVSYLLYHLPLVSWIRELSRYAILIGFSGALLFGLALHYLEQWVKSIYQTSLGTPFYILVFPVLNTIYWILFESSQIPLSFSLPWLLSFLFLLGLMTVRTSPWSAWLALAFLTLELGFRSVHYGPVHTALYPATYWQENRIYRLLKQSYGSYRVTYDMTYQSITPDNLGDVFPIQTKLGYCAAVNSDYYDFIHTHPGSETDDLLNIRYILTNKVLDSNFLFRDSIRELHLYERKNYYPRCYWKHQLGLPGKEIEAQNKTSIQELAYSDLYQKWAVDCTQPDTLIFSENDYPGWECTDNSKRIPIYRPHIKDHLPLFRSIALNRGRHLIEFRY